ncbi:hypothetical protein LMG7974_01346 [Campylobacter majalis]|uniref:Uncharacterized protein n=1 Tax=Campylobacter majalis TaxID=2790656 RepID=A0ABN7K9A3_9BACT|nr:hypothetical protein [Campylobacter majalis]CAD7289108.1 hypothetical protein LMG7974_01346 [Campylobacter majalis]
MQLSDLKNLASYQNFNAQQASNTKSNSKTKTAHVLTPSKATQISEQNSEAKTSEQQAKDIAKAIGDFTQYVGVARVVIDGKYTIWGKVNGSDKTVSKNEIDKANEIFAKYGVDFTSQKGYELLESTELSISDFIDQYESHMLSRHNQFFIDTRIKGGSTPDYGSLQTTSESFKPIQAVSKNTETYDINKDQKFAYLQELLKREQERGIDVLRLMQKLEEKGEKVVDKMI